MKISEEKKKILIESILLCKTDKEICSELNLSEKKFLSLKSDPVLNAEIKKNIDAQLQGNILKINAIVKKSLEIIYESLEGTFYPQAQYALDVLKTLKPDELKKIGKVKNEKSPTRKLKDLLMKPIYDEADRSIRN